jgi:DNA polymerase-1
MEAKQHLLSNFGPRLAEHINPVTGRLHASYRIAGAKSGRFTCSAPPLQQLPSAAAPEFKSCITAAPGCILISADWSQIELRAAAWISGDPALTAVYEEGRDLHVETAAAIAGIAPAEVTPQQRQCAKAVNFGSIYGIKGPSLAANIFDDYGIVMSVREATAALDRFFATYPVLKQWMEQNARESQWRGYVEIGCGRVHLAQWEVETRGHLTYSQCANLPIQGIAADCMLRALPLAHQRLAGLDGGLVACVHDELLAEVAEGDAAAAAAILEEVMVEAFTLTFPGAPLRDVVKVASGQSWYELK